MSNYRFCLYTFIAAVQLGQMSFSVLKMADGKSVNGSSVNGLYIHVCMHVCMYVYLFSSALIVSKILFLFL